MRPVFASASTMMKRHATSGNIDQLIPFTTETILTGEYKLTATEIMMPIIKVGNPNCISNAEQTSNTTDEAIIPAREILALLLSLGLIFSTNGCCSKSSFCVNFKRKKVKVTATKEESQYWLIHFSNEGRCPW